MREAGDTEPAVSSRPRLAGEADKAEADRPDMSLVRLDTRAEVSDWAEFCLVRAGVGSPTLPILVEILG